MYSWKKFNRAAGLVGLAALIGAAFGWWHGPLPVLALPPEVYPLPYHVPKYPGGISLRLAMVHDVIHERFPVHGKAYYQERNRRASAAIKAEEAKQAAGEKPTARYFELMDDLGVGLERLGRSGEAAALMRRKLDAQQRQGLRGRDLYTTYANLGTFLIHQQFHEGFADLAAAKERLREGAALIRKAIEVNPEAHFGREQWQLVAVEYLTASLDKPGLLLQFDLIGDRLDRTTGYSSDRILVLHSPFINHVLRKAQAYSQATEAEQRRMTGERRAVRRLIETAGAEGGWKDAVPDAQKEPVPFDEPVLGIVGMWRYGGGANPHFALALGEIMLRVGQRHIAWCAFERAARMSDRFSRDPAIAREFIEHCRARQRRIEKQLPAEEVKQLRPRFEAELAFGQRYQNEYQEYEARRIAEGADLDDPHFYDTFDAEHGPIATAPGPEEWIEIETPTTKGIYRTMWLFAGIFAFATACLLYGWEKAARWLKAAG